MQGAALPIVQFRVGINNNSISQLGEKPCKQSEIRLIWWCFMVFEMSFLLTMRLDSILCQGSKKQFFSRIYFNHNRSLILESNAYFGRQIDPASSMLDHRGITTYLWSVHSKKSSLFIKLLLEWTDYKHVNDSAALIWWRLIHQTPWQLLCGNSPDIYEIKQFFEHHINIQWNLQY